MSVSVYFSNQIIQIAVGTRARKGKLQKVYTTVAPEGSIIGRRLEPESLLQLLPTASELDKVFSINQ